MHNNVSEWITTVWEVAVTVVIGMILFDNRKKKVK
jgi:hypothetical protein